MGTARGSYDAIVAGAGPGGSAAAFALARRGISCLLLDQSEFPREKICGDGLTPQALVALEKLGCADEVLDNAECCIDACDLFIGNRKVLTGGFPQNGAYPGFCTLLPRKDLDHMLVSNAVAAGAAFVDGCRVTAVRTESGAVQVDTEGRGGKRSFSAGLLIGADGAGSSVSRSMGNDVTSGTRALSVRAYYSGVKMEGAQIKVFFDDEVFPGYGWIFVNDRGVANVGVGCVADPLFGNPAPIRKLFNRFTNVTAARFLDGAQRTSRVAGGWAAFSSLRRIVADRIMLIGDAAHHTDPLNGGGIHIAIEDALLAADVAAEALAAGDASAAKLYDYVRKWEATCGVDRRSAELLLSIAKNPALQQVCLFLLDRIGRMCAKDQAFADFCAGVFSGVIPQRLCLSPLALLSIVPLDPAVWLGGNYPFAGAFSLGAGGTLALLRSVRAAASRPLENLAWFIETFGKSIDAGLFIPPSTAAPAPVLAFGNAFPVEAADYYSTSQPFHHRGGHDAV